MHKKIEQLEALLAKEKDISSITSRRLGTERQRVRNHKNIIEGLKIQIKNLEIDLIKNEDDSDQFKIKADKVSARFDSALLLLRSVIKNGQIFNSTDKTCEICWQYNQEFQLNCGHGLCYRCGSELIIRGHATAFIEEQTEEEIELNIEYADHHVACPICRKIITDIEAVD